LAAREKFEAADRELREAQAVAGNEKEYGAIEAYLSGRYDPDLPYKQSIAFHYDVRACIAEHLGFDRWRESNSQTDLRKTVAAMARTIAELSGEKWDRR
jgi:hypothetical protein